MGNHEARLAGMDVSRKSSDAAALALINYLDMLLTRSMSHDAESYRVQR